MTRYLIVLVLGISLVPFSFETNFTFNLSSDEKMCFEEYFSDRTLVIYNISTQSERLEVKIQDPSDTTLYDRRDIQTFKHGFTTFHGGYYQSCIHNRSDMLAEVAFSIQSGVSAKDYSSIAKTKDLKPLELDLQKLDDKTQELSHFIAFAISHESIFEDILNGLTSKIMHYSGIVIGVMVVIGMLETFYLRKYMERRKII